MSVHILLHEIGEPFEVEIVDVSRKTRPDGSDYRSVAPRGMAPLIELPDGTALTENLVVAQYVCDAAGRTDLMPTAGSMDRYRVMEWQSFVASELHKSFVPLRWPLDAPTRTIAVDRIIGRLRHAERDIAGPYLTGETFTAADAYFFVIASWTRHFEIPLVDLPKIEALIARIAARPSVRAALDAEGPGLVTIDQPSTEK
jgi:glutathione S-transferase